MVELQRVISHKERDPQSLLPTRPLHRAKAFPVVPIQPSTHSSKQRDVALWRGPNLTSQDVCQSSLEHEKILYLMIVHFDYTSAPGSMVLFFCNVWERSISGYWSMPIRNQCCDIITFLHLQSRWIINEQVAEAPVSKRGNRYEGWAGGGGLKSLLCSQIRSI